MACAKRRPRRTIVVSACSKRRSALPIRACASSKPSKMARKRKPPPPSWSCFAMQQWTCSRPDKPHCSRLSARLSVRLPSCAWHRAGYRKGGACSLHRPSRLPSLTPSQPAAAAPSVASWGTCGQRKPPAAHSLAPPRKPQTGPRPDCLPTARTTGACVLRRCTLKRSASAGHQVYLLPAKAPRFVRMRFACESTNSHGRGHEACGLWRGFSSIRLGVALVAGFSSCAGWSARSVVVSAKRVPCGPLRAARHRRIPVTPISQ